MNRIYNVIWSKTKKCYVVVSEIVKTGGGKVKSVQTGTTWARMSAIMVVAALLMGGNITTVNAATYTAMTINDVNGAGYATGNVVYSEGSYLYNYQNPGNLTPFDNSHLYNGTDRGNYTENSFAGIAIGKNTNIQETGNPTYYSGLAIGNYAQATGGISFALGHYAQALSPSAMALGTATKASGFNSLAMMRQSAAEGEFSTALGTASWAKGNGSFAMGYSATAKADQSIAIGAAETIKLPGQQHGTPSAKYNGDGNTVTEGARSLAFGTKARTAVGADDSMAFGSSSSTGGANAVAMGYSANASAENAFAIGNTAQSSAQNAVAMGKSANASGVSSFAMGSSSNAAGADAIAMGSSSQAKLSNSIALGGNAKSLGADALALGGAANASKDGAIAIGKEAKANNTNTTAIGLGATVTGTNSMAIGTNAVAESNNSLALGTGTEVRGALVNGFSAFTNQQNNNVANGVVAVGNVGSERRIINVAGGENDTDATNVKQLKFVNSNLAKSIAGPTYTGYEANGSTYKAPDFNIKNSTYHTVKEAVEAAQTNFFSAKGTSADANYDNTGATGNNATAAGVRTSAAGNFATAVGADATAANANSTAIGYKAKSSVDDGVALGANSVASVAAGKAGYNVKIADSRTNGYSGLTGAALTSTMGAVSVGDGGTKTRQITNVAAGTADTDAVNVAQLRNVNLKVAGNTGKNDVLLDNQTLTVKGDGSYVTTSVNNQTIDVTLTDATKNKIDNAANKDLSNITDGGKSVIRDEAQKAVKVVAGKNTTITEGTDGTYKTYKVDVDAPDYQLVENSSAADKAYTVSGNKVDLTVQDAKNPANKKTVTIKDIASKTELDDTKTELINKGLKFDADNGGEKTNKLGSKVTVAGDGTNISTTITQTGDDTTVKVALGKDINVNTVTATKTVKAGTATMGNQSVTDNKSATQNGNFVSGLDNKNWTLTDPAFVSGRAATEDQLKIVSDAVKAANSSATDYRLIANPNNAADGSYKVDNNKVDLQVKDDKSGTVNTVTIKDIASKTELDKVKDRSVKYDGNTGHDTVTLEGANGTKITNLKDGNVAAGSKDAVNGGQLHDAKNELNTNISNAKTDLINKGLRFDADNNAEKTNKLGSKVTVNGDGNITTEITQTGDDTTIGVKLNKNLNVQTLTATDTVKAGGVTMGKHADTKNYVTGLDNKDWDVNTSNPVSGRAATEDQLKKISDVVKSQGAAATDYRLVKNAAAADEAYTVDSNGDVDLTVEDKNHAGQKETVKIKDVASKSSLDKLNDRAVKYDLDPAGTVDKTKVSYEGPAYANKTGGTHVTNVAYATGNNGSEAVNVDYLKDRIKDSEDALTNKGLKFDANNGGVKTNKLGSKVTVKGDNSNIITSISQDANGDSTIDVKLGKDLKTETITATGKDGKDGKIGINGKDGVTTNISVTRDGKPGVDGAAGTTTTRIVYQKPDGTNEEVANLNDGMLYGGDTGNVIKKKLNNQVNVKGGISDESKLATEDNIGVVSDGSDTLKLRLAKELKGLTSATFTNGGNNTVINGDGMTINRAGGNAVSLTKDGLNNGGNKITNVADGTDPNDAVNKSQLDKATAAASTTVSAGNNINVTPSTNANGSKNYEVSLKDQVTLGSDATKQIAMDGTTGTIKAGDKVTIDGNKGTIKAGNVTIDGENGTIKAGDKVTIDGKDGKIAAGKVSVDGKDGYVTGLENKDWDPNNITSGRAATEDQLQKSHKALDNKITNLGDEITKKGMNFAGNTGEFHRDLGQKVTIKGEGTESDDKYSGENIKTVADQDGNVTIKMAKNLKTDSLTTDKVKVGKNGKDGVSITGPNGVDGTDGKVGITGKDGKDAVSMSGKDGVGHIGLTGKDGRNADITVDKGDPDLDGNNITRIKYQDENGKTHQVATKDDGMKYGGDSGSVIKKKLNEQVNVVGGITDASKLTTEDNLGVVSDGTGNLKVRMAKDLKGLETVTTKDAAGNTTVMNGGGVTITPASGNAVSLTKDGLNNGGNTITNVGPGVNGTDAVNVNQLKGATDGLANAINSVAGETQRVGAHAAAMSALKPIQYDPLEPTQVMAGIGNYRGETAAALGVAHYTAEDTMFHVGVSVGSHHNMVNAGVTRKFGTSDAKKAVPERYKGGPISSMYVMQDEMTALKAKYEKVQRDNEEMRAQIALLMQQAGLK